MRFLTSLTCHCWNHYLAQMQAAWDSLFQE